MCILLHLRWVVGFFFNTKLIIESPSAKSGIAPSQHSVKRLGVRDKRHVGIVLISLFLTFSLNTWKCAAIAHNAYGLCEDLLCRHCSVAAGVYTYVSARTGTSGHCACVPITGRTIFYINIQTADRFKHWMYNGNLGDMIKCYPIGLVIDVCILFGILDRFENI